MKLVFILISILLHSLLFARISINRPLKPTLSTPHYFKVNIKKGTPVTLTKKSRPTGPNSKKIKQHLNKGNSNLKVHSLVEHINGDDLRPKYPWRSRMLKEEGIVILGYKINSKGYISELNIIQSSGHKRLDNAALDSLRGLKKSNLKPLRPVFKKVTFNFSLK